MANFIHRSLLTAGSNCDAVGHPSEQARESFHRRNQRRGRIVDIWTSFDGGAGSTAVCLLLTRLNETEHISRREEQDDIFIAIHFGGN